ncbi:hypothetical protein BH23GEM9_BH23GEM9_35300 [soil metagenome]
MADEGRTTTPAHAQVAALRGDIEATDQQIVALIRQRLELATALGAAKAEAGMPTADPVREAAVLRQVTGAAREAGLDVEAVRQIFWCLIGLCRAAQMGGQQDG